MTFLGGRSSAAWLAMCFGACLPDSYTAVPNRELDERQAVIQIPKSPQTSWRDVAVVSKYVLIKQIGKGGFSEIWLAERKGSNELLVLKAVDLTNPDLEPEEVANLVAESKFLRSLDCPYLLRCHETDANSEWLVLVLEYLSGGEIMDHIHKAKKYTEAEAAKLFAQMVSAVSYLHNLNLIHRDIKPENVLFVSPIEDCEAEGRPLRVKLIDLGMAALYDPEKPIHGCVGTPGFVAPELWNDKPHTPACDVYSLGVVLFIMMTGRKPHSGSDIRLMTYCNKSIRDAPGLKDERFLSLSAAARELLLAMLADDPRDRPSCMEVLRHPFITAVDSNAEAHREIEESVRRRMRELAQLRRVHGLRYALRVQKPQGAGHTDFLHSLEQRRLKLKREMGSYGRASENFGRASLADYTVGGAAAGFARSSLAGSYSLPPPVLVAPAVRNFDGGSDGTTTFGNAVAPTATATSASTTPSAATATAATPSAPITPPAPSPGGMAAKSFARGTSCDASPACGGVSNAVSGHNTPLAPQSLPQSATATEPPQLFSELQSATPASATAMGVSPPPLPAMGPSRVDKHSGYNTPDLKVNGTGLPVPNSSAAGQLPGLGGSTGFGANRNQQLLIDTMAVVNALPTLQRFSSADALTLEAINAAPLGAGGETPLDGGSPVATAALLAHARMVRCMSANSDTLELLGNQQLLHDMLEQVAVPVMLQDKETLRASAMGYHTLPPMGPPVPSLADPTSLDAV